MARTGGSYHAPAEREGAESVITSYSIHYTKLYDEIVSSALPPFDNWTVASTDSRTGGFLAGSGSLVTSNPTIAARN